MKKCTNRTKHLFFFCMFSWWKTSCRKFYVYACSCLATLGREELLRSFWQTHIHAYIHICGTWPTSAFLMVSMVAKSTHSFFPNFLPQENRFKLILPTPSNKCRANVTAKKALKIRFLFTNKCLVFTVIGYYVNEEIRNFFNDCVWSRVTRFTTITVDYSRFLNIEIFQWKIDKNYYEDWKKYMGVS